MTGRYRVLPTADRDLDDQAAYLATQASLVTALRFYDAAASTFGELADMPGCGEPWSSVNPRLSKLRVWRIKGFEKHVIFYRQVEDGSEIVRVLHGARDLKAIFEEDLE